MKILSLVALLTIATAPTFAFAQSSAQSPYAKGTRVAGVSIAGLNQTEAIRRLKRELAPRLERKVALVSGAQSAYRKRSDLGFSLDVGKMLAQAKAQSAVALAFRVDAATASRAMKRLSPHLATEVRDAMPVYFGDGVQIRPEIVGKNINPSTSAARLKILAEKEPARTRFPLAETAVQPKVTKADLKGIDAVIGSYTTRFNPGVIGRTENIRVALKSLDGKVVPDGKTFSLNNAVGERTNARGFKQAIIFEDGKEKKGLGGGVSQITGTLFNAALKAGLPIVTYRTHSRPVAYITLGRDATVAWGSFDNKWKNDTGAPIYISYGIKKGSRLKATLFGKDTGRTTKIRVTSKRIGPRDIRANLYRVIYKNGKVVKSGKVGSSHYNWKADDED